MTDFGEGGGGARDGRLASAAVVGCGAAVGKVAAPAVGALLHLDAGLEKHVDGRRGFVGEDGVGVRGWVGCGNVCVFFSESAGEKVDGTT